MVTVLAANMKSLSHNSQSRVSLAWHPQLTFSLKTGPFFRIFCASRFRVERWPVFPTGCVDPAPSLGFSGTGRHQAGCRDGRAGALSWGRGGLQGRPPGVCALVCACFVRTRSEVQLSVRDQSVLPTLRRPAHQSPFLRIRQRPYWPVTNGHVPADASECQ